jgi:hypothetical protein
MEQMRRKSKAYSRWREKEQGFFPSKPGEN